MYENPQTLEKICLEFICDNLHYYIEPYEINKKQLFNNNNNNNNNNNKNNVESNNNNNNTDSNEIEKYYKFKDTDLFLINEISEKLLQKLLEKNQLNDSIIHIFTETNTKLRSIKLKNCKLTQNGLKILKQHKIIDLECVDLRKISIGNILDCLNNWSQSNMVNVNFSYCSFIDLSRHSYMVKITILKNLKSLNLSFTELNQTSFQMICEDLKYLEKLDISGTLIKDLSPLIQLSNQIISLSICDLYQVKNLAETVHSLRNLRYLDISLFNDKIKNKDFKNCPLIQLLNDDDDVEDYDDNDDNDDNDENDENNTNKDVKLKNLELLDLSGWCDYISRDLLIKFVNNHKKLKFIGLVLNDLTFDIILLNYLNQEFNNIKIAGLGNEEQIIITLKKYTDRSNYIQKALYHLFQLTNNFQDARSDIFELILPVMNKHSNKFGVQMAATACLYNLTRGELSKKIHPKLLSWGVNLTLQAMEIFPGEFQLQKNSLLTLCSDTILQDINFDRYRCAKLVLDALCSFEEINMNRMAVAICSILAAKVSTDETSELGAKPLYMRKLLSMVKSRCETKISDITLKFTLSALWNLTDESAATCSVFLEHGGALLFLNVLKIFKNDGAIETKVLGLLNNIAEVINLRKNLMLDELIIELINLLKSDNIDVSYFAAGIIAHLLSDGDDKWLIKLYKRKFMLDELENAVKSWKIPDSEMVAYRSFRPFFSLLKPNMNFQVQLWAVWAIHHVCTKNPKRYCQMLKDENGYKLLDQLNNYHLTHPDIKIICMQILETVENNI